MMDRIYTNRPDIVVDISDAVRKTKSSLVLWEIGHNPEYEPDLWTMPADWKQYDYIFLIDKEARPYLQQLLHENDNVYVWDSLVCPGGKNFNSYFWWWDLTHDVYRFQNIENKLNCSEKHKIFDCLLGLRKPNSDFLHHAIRSNRELISNIILNYFGNGDTWLPAGDHDTLDELYKIGQSACPESSGFQLRFNSMQYANASVWIPWKIYNQSWFSIVVESRTDSTRFFSEKIAKPIMAKRLFVLAGAPGMLRDLQYLGFKTFGLVIDESYDLIVDDADRRNALLEQIKWVCSQDPIKILNKVRPILEHNYMLMTRDRQQDIMIAQMKGIIDK